MGWLTVVEAAGVSGLAPEAVRSMIESGRLPARTVALENGQAYLIESADLERLRQELLEAPDAGVGDPLAGALAGLRAALARRRDAPESPTRLAEGDELAEEPPVTRVVGGLNAAELQTLGMMVERLLEPPTPSGGSSLGPR